ncbi:MAG: hypothetical protein ACK5CS_21365, partial [Bradyrhizobium sp.]
MTSTTEPLAATPAQPTRRPLSELVRRWAVFVLLGALFVLFSLREPAFLTLPNVMSVLQAVSVVAIIGVGRRDQRGDTLLRTDRGDDVGPCADIYAL